MIVLVKGDTVSINLLTHQFQKIAKAHDADK